MHVTAWLEEVNHGRLFEVNSATCPLICTLEDFVQRRPPREASEAKSINLNRY